jgi:thioredoxin-like negative regulator of GroEL
LQTRFVLFRIDTTKSERLAERFEIRACPTLIVYSDKVTARHMGYQTAEQLKKWLRDQKAD